MNLWYVFFGIIAVWWIGSWLIDKLKVRKHIIDYMKKHAERAGVGQELIELLEGEK